MKQIFFQSSLPRAGSTLLQNILAQNPDFHATPTSGVLDLLLASKNVYNSLPEFKAQNADVVEEHIKGFWKGGLEGYFSNIKEPYVIDKCRGWSAFYDLVNLFYPNPKMVCMIRDPRDIFTSMENNYRKNPLANAGVVDTSKLKGTTVEKRIDHFAANIPVGLSFDRLRDIISQGIHRNILFIKFEDLTKDPQAEMNKIYDYFEVERFKHDFNNIEQITQEDDRIHGPFGDHKVRQVVAPIKSKAVETLGPAACQWIRQNYDWFYQEFKYY